MARGVAGSEPGLLASNRYNPADRIVYHIAFGDRSEQSFRPIPANDTNTIASVSDRWHQAVVQIRPRRAGLCDAPPGGRQRERSFAEANRVTPDVHFDRGDQDLHDRPEFLRRV